MTNNSTNNSTGSSPSPHGEGRGGASSKQIFLKALRHLLDPYDRSIERIPFDIVYGEKDGTVVNARAVCTSSNFKNDTFNFKYTESGEVRTVHAQLLFRVNGMEVMI